MPGIFYEIFNNKIEINEELLKKLLEEIKEIFKVLKKRDDVDNITILKNKIIHLLEEKHKKIDKKTKKQLKHIKNFLEEEIDEYLEKKQEMCVLSKNVKKTEVIDVVEKVKKRYKKCKDIPEEKRHKYRESCIKISNYEYEKELIVLQLELLKLQNYIKESWEKLLIIFEGRDAAWKWWTIKRFTEYLNPRWASVVALNKPTEVEKTQWYFQRYINHLPSWGEIKFFDRSWYNRAWVEPVMWFCTKDEYEQFLHDVPRFEKMLVDSWIKLIKLYFSVSKEEQAKRFAERRKNPLKQYKLSPVDQFSQQLRDKYTVAGYKMFYHTHKKETPWVIIKSDDKKKARINAIKHVLNQFDYPWKIDKKRLVLDPLIVTTWSSKLIKMSSLIDLDVDLFE